jgi:hypothetical protein
VITAVLAFSMKDTLGNVLGGVVLQLDQSIRVGDWVRLEDVSGRVVEIRWRHTAIETRNRETVVVPNSWLMTNRFTVIGSRADPRPLWRRWVRVNVDLAASPTAVCAALERPCATPTFPTSSATASAVLLEIGPRYGSALRYFLSNPQLTTPRFGGALARARLPRTQGHEAGCPTRRSCRSRTTSEPRIAAACELSATAACSRTASCSAASPARSWTSSPASSFTLLRARRHHRARATSALALHHRFGQCRGRDRDLGRAPAARHPPGGSVFGEMGMMTGEPRATVIARSDVDRYRLDKAGFDDPARSPRRGQRHLAGARQPRDRAGERHRVARQRRCHRPGGERSAPHPRHTGLEAP